MSDHGAGVWGRLAVDTDVFGAPLGIKAVLLGCHPTRADGTAVF